MAAPSRNSLSLPYSALTATKVRQYAVFASVMSVCCPALHALHARAGAHLLPKSRRPDSGTKGLTLTNALVDARGPRTEKGTSAPADSVKQQARALGAAQSRQATADAVTVAGDA